MICDNVRVKVHNHNNGDPQEQAVSRLPNSFIAEPGGVLLNLIGDLRRAIEEIKCGDSSCCGVAEQALALAEQALALAEENRLWIDTHGGF